MDEYAEYETPHGFQLNNMANERSAEEQIYVVAVALASVVERLERIADGLERVSDENFIYVKVNP